MSWLLPPLRPTFDAALRDVHARGIEARAAAAERLGEPEPGRGGQALEGLLVLCGDPAAPVRAAAVRALKQLGDAAALAPLLERIDDEDALVRELAVVALGALSDERAKRALLRALRNQHPEVRFQAVASYAEVCDANEAAAVIEMLADEDAKVRANAARSLARFGALARQALLAASSEPDALARGEIALALARIGETPDLAELRACLNHPELALETLDAIGERGLTTLLEPVAALAASLLTPLGLKVAAARALVRLGDSRGVPALKEVLRALRSEGRSYAVQVVGELKLHALADELERLSRRLRGTEPQALVEALLALAPESPAARAGLERLGKRGDRAGDLAREALQTFQAR